MMDRGEDDNDRCDIGKNKNSLFTFLFCVLNKLLSCIIYAPCTDLINLFFKKYGRKLFCKFEFF